VTHEIVEITDSIQARRCHYAQYRGEKATLKLNGLSVTGMVRSVLEDKSTTPTRWIVSILVQHTIAAYSVSLRT
jgi:hypothetical protein